MTSTHNDYPIGTPGQKWGADERDSWLGAQAIKRSYEEEVVSKIQGLNERFELEQYGSLSFQKKCYPLFALKSRAWAQGRRNVLITGGVHGYETSGVQGAIRFLETEAERYGERFNILVTPCISPWGYETINRWNPDALDPNRSFYADSPCQESAALMQYVTSQELTLALHIDLHETTDTDGSEFRPALAARDGQILEGWEDIPDGFYLCGSAENPQPEFQAAIIRAVEDVTHIAPPDSEGRIIGEALQQKGVINYQVKALGLCVGFTDASYCTTTEVYPDSPAVDDENCIAAQVTAVTAGLDYLLSTTAP